MKKDEVRTTIRLLDGHEDVYQEYKKVVIERLHSDICYVTTMLFESFINAVNETPNADSPFIMNFLKQNVQINMGCDFNYYTKKARRTPQDLTGVVADRHNLIPEVLDQYPQLSQKARDFWFREFQEQGLIPKQQTDPFISTGKSEEPKVNFFRKFLKHCITFVTKVWRRFKK